MLNIISVSWYGDYMEYPTYNLPYIRRGGDFRINTQAGIFDFSRFNGNASPDIGFRVTIPVLQ